MSESDEELTIKETKMILKRAKDYYKNDKKD